MKLFFKVGLIINFSFAIQNLYAFQSWCYTDQFTEAEKDIIESSINHQLNKKQIVGVITIPVVFHIVYNNEEQNIDDSLIYSQMEVINEDFRKLNTDISNIRNVFKDLAADVEIEFCLAGIDPDGNPTTGITRTSSTVAQHTVNGIKYDSSGGANIWPRDKYLNIWTGLFKSNILGFSRFPWQENSEIDGIVIKYSEVGRTSANRGRVLTHEIGHWFGLYHTFEGGCPFSTTYDCATSGDWICDTPPIIAATNGCSGNDVNTCMESSNDQIDMWENFMDYTNGACRVMFTKQQVERMHYYLNILPRREIIENIKCNTTSSNQIKERKDIIFYPNPVTSSLFIEIDKKYIHKMIEWTAYNITGEIIDHSAALVQNEVININTSSWPKGGMLLRLITDTEQHFQHVYKY